MFVLKKAHLICPDFIGSIKQEIELEERAPEDDRHLSSPLHFGLLFNQFLEIGIPLDR